AALIVNNGAAAVLLALTALAKGRSVVVSRGELVEIGGGFRVPDVMASSGARLLEVGTTNRTHPRDYENACQGRDVAMLLKVHPSNYQITGFTSDVSVETLAEMERAPVVVDLGSGLLDEKCGWLKEGPPKWLRNEPAVRQTLQAGADLVTYSGDKLLGGPQAGIMVGSKELIENCARHPLARALRPGGLVLAALQDTFVAYLNGSAGEIPLWSFAAASVDSLRRRATALGAGEPCDTMSTMGGGSVPGSEIPSAGVRIVGDHRAALRVGELPIMARMDGDSTVIDLRAVDPSDDQLIGLAIASLP
ncbi:MAG: L-seryl-tRNA(Sec) selenium transferase, partial [Acidimicrobiales bacterium]